MQTVLTLAHLAASTTHRYGDEGWYDFRPLRPKYPTHLWYMSRDAGDWQRVRKLDDTTRWNRLRYRKGKGDSENTGAWLGFLNGKNPDYPLEILQGTYDESLRRLEMR